MRTFRITLAAITLVVAFFFVTTDGSVIARQTRNALHLPNWVGRPDKVEIIQAATQEPTDSEEINNVNVYKKVLPSVVNITSTAVAFDFFYGAVPQQGQGSGFIIDKEGHILTNYHVIADARKVEVTLSNRKKYTAQVVGFDRPRDLAVIKINAPDLVPATLGDSKSLQVGQKVYAIGNPFGLSGTMTRGIISSIRSVRGPEGNAIDEAIQTDAAINPGNSGGPLLNWHGAVIGINAMILTGGAEQSAGVGFAIPINSAKAVLNDLVQFGQVRRPSLGITAYLPIGPELAEEIGLPADSGVLIQQVTPGGAAERAGLRGGRERAYLGNTPVLLGGDLITGIDNEEIESPEDISRALTNHHAGDNVIVKIFRGKRQMQVQVTLDESRGQLRG